MELYINEKNIALQRSSIIKEKARVAEAQLEHDHGTDYEHIFIQTSDREILETSVRTPRCHHLITIIPLKHQATWRRKGASGKLPLPGFFKQATVSTEPTSMSKSESADSEGPRKTTTTILQPDVVETVMLSNSGLTIRVVEYHLSDLAVEPACSVGGGRVVANMGARVRFLHDPSSSKGLCHGLRRLRWKAARAMEDSREWWRKNSTPMWSQAGPIIP